MTPDNEHIPEALRRDLKRVYRTVSPEISHSIDEAIRQTARRRLLARRRQRWGLSAGAAAVLAGAAFTYVFQRDAAPPGRVATATAVQNDVNRDGATDIRDVLQLARDGRASAAEIDALARAAVRLPEVSQ